MLKQYRAATLTAAIIIVAVLGVWLSIAIYEALYSSSSKSEAQIIALSTTCVVLFVPCYAAYFLFKRKAERY